MTLSRFDPLILFSSSHLIVYRLFGWYVCMFVCGAFYAIVYPRMPCVRGL